jgi:FimV-like protein
VGIIKVDTKSLCLGRSNSRIGVIVGLLVLGCCNVIITSAFVIGMGAVTVESFIGEKLDLSIPIVDIDGSDQLTLEVDQDSVSLLGASPLVVELEKRDDRLFARIRSHFLVTEPYLSFSLELSDSNSRSAKQFTVLLDLAPMEKALKNAQAVKRAELGSSVTPSTISSAAVKPSRAGQGAGKSVAQYNTQSNRVTTRNNGKLSGGARVVVPRETLWGIARNVSKGASVSINQMMLAIYRNNSSALANESIDLLKAGSSINIPDFESASHISSRATQRIKELSGSRYVAKNILELADSPPEKIDSQEETLSSLSAQGSSSAEQGIVNTMFSAEDLDEQSADEIDDSLVKGDVGQSYAFKLTGIAEAADGSSIGLLAINDPQAQAMIDSLAATVGNLTQDIIAKDKKVQFLEDRIRALESLQV